MQYYCILTIKTIGNSAVLLHVSHSDLVMYYHFWKQWSWCIRVHEDRRSLFSYHVIGMVNNWLQPIDTGMYQLRIATTKSVSEPCNWKKAVNRNNVANYLMHMFHNPGESSIHTRKLQTQPESFHKLHYSLRTYYDGINKIWGIAVDFKSIASCLWLYLCSILNCFLQMFFITSLCTVLVSNRVRVFVEIVLFTAG